MHEFESSTLIYREICSDDKEFLRVLRNRNRHKFFDDREISKPQQDIWFEKYENSEDEAIFIISLAVVYNIGRIYLPHIHNHRQYLSQWASKSLGRSITIGSVSGEFIGLRPFLSFHDVTIKSTYGDTSNKCF